MNRFAVGYSDINDPKGALNQVFEQLSTGMGRREPLLIIFCSDIDNFDYYSKQLRHKFPFSKIMGMSAYMGFSSRGYGKHAISCLAIMDGIEVVAGYMNDEDADFGKYVDKIIASADKLKSTENTLCFSCGAKMFDLDELNRLISVFEGKDIKLCGGSLGEAEGVKTRISFNGEIFDKGGIFCLIHNLNGRIELLMESMEPEGLESIWNRTLDSVRSQGIKPQFTIVANGIDFTRMMEDQELLYKFTDKLCMEFGEYIGFSGYKDEKFFKDTYDSMVVAVFE